MVLSIPRRHNSALQKSRCPYGRYSSSLRFQKYAPLAGISVGFWELLSAYSHGRPVAAFHLSRVAASLCLLKGNSPIGLRPQGGLPISRRFRAVDRRLRIRNLEEEGEALSADVDRPEPDTCDYFERLEDDISSIPPLTK
jgi:hypothetical protein